MTLICPHCGKEVFLSPDEVQLPALVLPVQPVHCPMLQPGFRDALHCGSRTTVFADGAPREDAHLHRRMIEDYCLKGWESCPYYVFSKTGRWNPNVVKREGNG